MQGECPELQKKFKKDKVKRPNTMLVTWSDEELDSSSGSEDQVANLCLMAHEDNSSEVNSKIDSITTKQWEEFYKNLDTKYKKLKYENKSLKVKITAQDNLEYQLKKLNAYC